MCGNEPAEAGFAGPGTALQQATASAVVSSKIQGMPSECDVAYVGADRTAELADKIRRQAH